MPPWPEGGYVAYRSCESKRREAKANESIAPSCATVLWWEYARLFYIWEREMTAIEKREAITIRFPARVIESIRQAKDEDESLNDFVVRVLEKEARWVKARKAHEDIVQLGKRIMARHGGPLPDSTQMIRELREGRGRYD